MSSPGHDVATEESKSKKRARVYERWEGNERFFCYGHLVAGPNWRASLGTAALIAAPAGVFLGLVAPYLMFHVQVVIMVFSCLLPALSLLFLFLTACIDPGIIPRQEPDQEYLEGRKPRTKEVHVNNQRVVIRYNDTCHFYQPPRAHHCSVNDNCIERFDHHCPWVGTTIGKRNYRTFLLFVYTTTVLCLYVFGCCLAQLFVRHNELVDEAKAAGTSSSNAWGKTVSQLPGPASIALMAYTFLFFWFVGGLSIFHCYLTGSNQTTYENFRYNHESRPNPYDRGILRNCAEVWCVPIPRSQVRFRAYIDEVRVSQAVQMAEAADEETGDAGGGGPVHRAAGSLAPVPPTAQTFEDHFDQQQQHGYTGDYPGPEHDDMEVEMDMDAYDGQGQGAGAAGGSAAPQGWQGQGQYGSYHGHAVGGHNGDAGAPGAGGQGGEWYDDGLGDEGDGGDGEAHEREMSAQEAFFTPPQSTSASKSPQLQANGGTPADASGLRAQSPLFRPAP